jgi:hypothetical protein
VLSVEALAQPITLTAALTPRSGDS